MCKIGYSYLNVNFIKIILDKRLTIIYLYYIFKLNIHLTLN
ncbi:hypothetical protein PMI13_01657 [Chryseobacterium populi]|uniref:Uncharacterized protein n=1 Tax=Chryseobacterium populi TaxID=1144316 RepID=J3CJZ5_9FLAO|nr:hypothetical protein PMI13_01657 [Chryseobacterium populi]